MENIIRPKMVEDKSTDGIRSTKNLYANTGLTKKTIKGL